MKHDYAGVISASGKGGCESTGDNEIVLCAEAVTIKSGGSSVDLTALARRMLSEETSDAARSSDLDEMKAEIEALRAQVDKLTTALAQ